MPAITMDTVEEGEEDLSFDLNQSAGGGPSTPAEREMVSLPSTPKRITPPFTPPSRSPNHQSTSSATNNNTASSSHHTPTDTRPSSSYVSPVAPRSPLISAGNAAAATSKTPRTPRTPWTPSLISPRILSPLGTPVKRMMTNMKSYMEDVGHLTKLNPQDTWLPITESRTGNAYYAAFHNLNAGIGFPGLLLPIAMYYLGWTWGIIALTVAYVWQLYTLWVLVRLHEAVPGVRYSRYVQLAQAAFGEKLGYWLATPPNINLTAGTSTTLIIIGGSTLKLFDKLVCGPDCKESPLSTIEWYLVFSVLSLVLAQLPNLNSIAGLSLVGAATAVTYCTMIWVLSISRGRPPGITYGIADTKSILGSTFSILNALGIMAFSFRGHNLTMEIQATMPSTLKHPAHIPMWRGVKVASAIIAMCYFPIALAGYWAYGSMMLPSGILFSMYAFHQMDISPVLMGCVFLLVVINCLSSFQIYSMTIYDNFEAGYTRKRNQPISKHVRVLFRVFYVFTNFLIGVAFPWLSGLTGLLGGLTSAPVTFAFPCFMWLAIKKPKKFSFSWYLNWTLGIGGMLMAVGFSAGGIWSIVVSGQAWHFFKAS